MFWASREEGSEVVKDGKGIAESRGRTRWWVAAAVAVLALVVGLLVVVAVRSGDSSSDGDGTAGASTSGATSSPSPTDTSTRTSEPASSSAGTASQSGEPSSTDSSTEEATGTPSDANAGRPHAKPQGFAASVSASGDVTVSVTKVEAVESKAEIAGETSRPALRLTISAANSGGTPVTIQNAVVNAYYGPDLTPATSVMKPGSRWFPKQIPARGVATGIFLFNIPRDQRDNVTVEVDLDTGLKIVTFEGKVTPRG